MGGSQSKRHEVLRGLFKNSSTAGATGLSHITSSAGSQDQQGQLKQHRQEAKLPPRRAKTFDLHHHFPDDDISVMQPHHSSPTSTPRHHHRPVSAVDIAPASGSHDDYGFVLYMLESNAVVEQLDSSVVICVHVWCNSSCVRLSCTVDVNVRFYLLKPSSSVSFWMFAVPQYLGVPLSLGTIY
ncbi:hypothetical protein Aperf_G00000063793 [Anoplocephala perfoliata]